MKPIIFELTDRFSEKNNILGYDEILIIKQWEKTVLYLGVCRKEGVVSDIYYCQTVNQTHNAEFFECLTEFYDFKGFAPDGYLTDLRKE